MDLKSGIRFTKMHALGNDYLVLEEEYEQSITTAFVRGLCDRHFGIGGDGLLLGPIGSSGGAGKGRFGLRIFNADGSECEKSGNGLRMFAAYLRRFHTDLDTFIIELPSESCKVSIVDRKQWYVQVAMGAADVKSKDSVGENMDLGRLVFDEVLIGNPHSVVFVDAPSTESDARSIGPIVSASSSQSARGSNVQLCYVVDRETVGLQIWERGSGYTLASGSSACAAVVAAYARGEVDQLVQVHMPGGVVQVEVVATGGRGDPLTVLLSGSCAFVSIGTTI